MQNNDSIGLDKIYLQGYDLIILDCDGVILNSNFIKEANIKSILNKHLSGDILFRCLSYFNSNPGISREKKLRKFITDPILLELILKEYNDLNLKSLVEVSLVEGVLDFLESANAACIEIIVLSGGDQDELIYIFKKLNIFRFFKNILGGPISKKEHLLNLKLPKNSIFFGDSVFDLETAIAFKIDFGFIYGQTNQILFEYKYFIKIIAPNFKNIKIRKND